MPSHSLTNFEILKYGGLRFNGVYSRNNLPKIKNGAYVMNLDKYNSIGTHWKALFLNGAYGTYLNSFGVEHIWNEVEKLIGNWNTTSNILGYKNTIQ